MKSKGLKKLILLGTTMIITTTIILGSGKIQVKAEGAPEITFVGIEHSPLIQGDTEAFTITTKNASKVQYRILLCDTDLNVLEDLTNGYTGLVNAKVPYKVEPSKRFELGLYKLKVQVKAEGSTSDYDNEYIANINCVNSDEANRIYVNGKINVDKDTYKVGEKVVINGIQGIHGVGEGYKYRLHLYNATTDTWTKNVTQYNDKIEWTPTVPGTYVLDIYANTPASSTWNNYLNNNNNSDTYGTYEGWKLKVVTVTGADGSNANSEKNETNGSSSSESNVKVFEKENIREISNYNQYTVDTDNKQLTLMCNADHKDKVEPNIKVDSSFNTFNPELSTIACNIASAAMKDNTYTYLFYNDKTKESMTDNQVRIQHYTDNTAKHIIFIYSLYTEDTIKLLYIYLLCDIIISKREQERCKKYD